MMQHIFLQVKNNFNTCRKYLMIVGFKCHELVNYWPIILGSSQRSCSLKQALLETSQSSYENTRQSLILITLSLRLTTSLKKGLRPYVWGLQFHWKKDSDTGVFIWFLRIPFLQNTFGVAASKFYKVWRFNCLKRRDHHIVLTKRDIWQRVGKDFVIIYWSSQFPPSFLASYGKIREELEP